MVIISNIVKVGYQYRIDTDAGHRWWVTGKDLAELNVRPGVEIDPEKMQQQVVLLQYPRGLNLAVRMLAGRACSMGEIDRKLKACHYDREVCELVLYKLEKEGFLNDAEFSSQWIHYRSGQQYGSRRIRQELKAKGVSEEQIDKAMEDCDDEESLSQAVVYAQKKLRQQKAGDDPVRTRQKVIQALVRRGYDWDIAKKAWTMAVSQDD